MSQTVSVQVEIKNIALLKKVCEKLGYTYNLQKNTIEGNLYRPAKIEKNKIIFDSVDSNKINAILNEYAYEDIKARLIEMDAFIIGETRTQNEIVLEIELPD